MKRDIAAVLAAGGHLADAAARSVPMRRSDSVDSEENPPESGAAWPVPVPLDAVEGPPFPVEVLPPCVRRFVEELAAFSETPPDLAGLLSLSVVASALARRVRVEVRPGYSEPANLYAVVALPSANRKSSVFGAVVEPLREHEADEARRLAPRIAEAAEERRILEARLKHAEGLVTRAKDPAERDNYSDEARRLAVELEAFAVPAVPKLIVDSTTPEALVRVLAEQGGRLAALSAEGELFSILGGRYHEGAPPIEAVLQAWSGDMIRVDRRSSPPVMIDRPALTIGLAVQPDVIRSLSSRREFRGRGLLGRFLFSIPRSLVGTRTNDKPPVSEAARSDFRALLRSLLELTADADENGDEVEHVAVLSPAAARAHHDYFLEVEPHLAAGGDFATLADWAGKLCGNVARVALALHAAEHAPSPPWSRPIEVRTMTRAIWLGRYLADHARVAFSLMGEDPRLEAARRVLAYLRRHRPEVLPWRDVQQGVRGLTPEELQEALSLLEEHGYLRALPEKARSGAGRPPGRAYAVSPHARK